MKVGNESTGHTWVCPAAQRPRAETARETRPSIRTAASARARNGRKPRTNEIQAQRAANTHDEAATATGTAPHSTNGREPGSQLPRRSQRTEANRCSASDMRAATAATRAAAAVAAAAETEEEAECFSAARARTATRMSTASNNIQALEHGVPGSEITRTGCVDDGLLERPHGSLAVVLIAPPPRLTANATQPGGSAQCFIVWRRMVQGDGARARTGRYLLALLLGQRQRAVPERAEQTSPAMAG